MLEAGIADAADIDAAVSDGLAPRWTAAGPLATADLGGLATFALVAGLLQPHLSDAHEVSPELPRRAASGPPFAEWTAADAAAVADLRAAALAQGREIAERRRGSGVIRLSAHLSTLFPDVPELERPTAARSLGFTSVETWWPPAGDRDAWVAAVSAASVRAVLVNADGGDLAAGERGFCTVAERHDEVVASVRDAMELARACGGATVNLLAGRVDPAIPEEAQRAAALDGGARRRRRGGAARRAVVIEHFNAEDVARPLLPTPALAAAFVRDADHEGVRLLFDAYHAHRAGVDPIEAVGEVADVLGHVQYSDSPGAGRAGHRRDRPRAARRPPGRGGLRRPPGPGVHPERLQPGVAAEAGPRLPPGRKAGLGVHPAGEEVGHGRRECGRGLEGREVPGARNDHQLGVRQRPRRGPRRRGTGVSASSAPTITSAGTSMAGRSGRRSARPARASRARATPSGRCPSAMARAAPRLAASPGATEARHEVVEERPGPLLAHGARPRVAALPGLGGVRLGPGVRQDQGGDPLRMTGRQRERRVAAEGQAAHHRAPRGRLGGDARPPRRSAKPLTLGASSGGPCPRPGKSGAITARSAPSAAATGSQKRASRGNGWSRTMGGGPATAPTVPPTRREVRRRDTVCPWAHTLRSPPSVPSGAARRAWAAWCRAPPSPARATRW